MNIRSPVSRAGVARTASRQRGFSMIEVLIALVVLAVGLLGLALLQTTNLRYTQSANLRTQATNLGTELLDTIRANRSEADAYDVALDGTAFPAAVMTDALDGCGMPATMTAAANMARWQCEVIEALGPAANATLTINPATNQATLLVAWDDEFWAALADKTANSGQITLVSQL